MRKTVYESEKVIEALYKNKVLTKKELIKLAGCSDMTLWRILKSHGYFTSYNFNASYYTLIDIPKFDDNGLWIHRGIRFSRYGSLTNTVTELVYRSAGGLSAWELKEIVGVMVMPTLTRLFSLGKITREKLATVFIYLHVDKGERKRQIENRQQDIRHEIEKVMLPEAKSIIAVLVELIKTPNLSPQNLSRKLSREGHRITTKEVEMIFNHYQLPQKKT